MKLPKKHANHIASLINDISVAELMFKAKQDEGNTVRAAYWMKQGYMATAELGDAYGIYLPNYTAAAEYTANTDTI